MLAYNLILLKLECQLKVSPKGEGGELSAFSLSLSIDALYFVPSFGDSMQTKMKGQREKIGRPRVIQLATA